MSIETGNRTDGIECSAENVLTGTVPLAPARRSSRLRRGLDDAETICDFIPRFDPPIDIPHFDCISQVPPKHYERRYTQYCVASEGKWIAFVLFKREGIDIYELPGGGVQQRSFRGYHFTEHERDTVKRETLEETGLRVNPGVRFAEACQYYVRSDGVSFTQNHCAAWTAIIEGVGEKLEPNHYLVFLTAEEGILRLRHRAHVYFVTEWTRKTSYSQKVY